MAAPMQDPYPEVELAPPPRAHPLVEPRLVSPPPAVGEDDGPLYKAPSFLPDPGARTTRAKRESYNLSGSTYLITNTGKTLKLPVPSDSKADPLNWSTWKKAGAIFSIALFSVVCLTAAQAAAVMLDGIQTSFQHENVQPWLLKAAVTGPNLFMGVGCFFWVPLSIGLGRRPTILIATLVALFATVWASEARSFGAFVTAVCFLGMSEGLGLSLAFLMVIDLTYISQRSRAVALMWCMAGCLGTSAVALVPIMSHHGHDWRAYYHYWSIPLLVSLLVTFFLYPETYFKRPTVAYAGLVILQSATEKLTVYEDIEKDSNIYRDLPEYPIRTGFAGLRDRLGLARSPFASWVAMGRCFLQMGYCAANPLIFWVFIASSFNSASMIYIGATYTRILLAPPYNMSPNVVGTVNVASGVGALFGFISWYYGVTKVVRRLSQRNRGVLEAEHYLIGYIVPVVSGALSTLFYGLAVEYQWSKGWIFFSYGLNGFSFVTIMIANTLWVTEAFPRWAAPALAVVGGGCYLLSFAMSFALVPWIDSQGYKWVGIQLMLLQIVGGLVAMPVAFWGKSARQAIQGRWAEDRSGALRPL
ncbi:hypothetical protein NX059_010841 [Plenodomus lindquistii]|nr:hypothetical protein NX059_010841 [Plenodomus lindquistii]